MRLTGYLRAFSHGGQRVLRFCYAPLAPVLEFMRRAIISSNFITLHHAYFTVTCLVFSGIFYGISRPIGSVSYIDSLFLVVSAMTLTGLNTVNLSTVSTVQQLILFCLIIFGSAVFVSGFVVHVRKRAFERRFLHMPSAFSSTQAETGKSSGTRPPIPSGTNVDDPEKMVSAACSSPSYITGNNGFVANRISEMVNHNHHDPDMLASPSQGGHDATSHVTFQQLSTSSNIPCAAPPPGLIADSISSIRNRASNQDLPISAAQHNQATGTLNSHSRTLFTQASVSRNSRFHDLSEKERKALGGYEYRAVQLLSWLVPTYFLLFQLLGCLGLGAYVAYNKAGVARHNGLNPWWVGSFNAVSAFNNCGMSLLDANMVAFQTSIYMLITMTFLILCGNTCYPIFLRLIVWSFYKILPSTEKWQDQRQTLQFLLEHPRRCYTNLFPSHHTWWLLAAVVTLNSIDWAAFDLMKNSTTASLSPGIRILDGLFQAVAVRHGGFYVVPISNVRISLQVLYVIMMYISVYPVAIAMRNTNVYEERSLGIYADDPEYVAARSASQKSLFARVLRIATPWDETTHTFVRHQVRAQLAHDLWCVVLAVFVIMCIEAGSFEKDPKLFSVFNVIFEVISAYGCVGISVGLPDQAYSFAGALRTGSKLVLCCVMLRGRHRGLPVAIDKAIMLPREGLDEVEEDNALRGLEQSAGRDRV